MSALTALETHQEQNVFSIITEQEKKAITDEIVCGMELKFNYINGDKFIRLMETKGIQKKNIRYLDILKYNYNQLILQLIYYFPDIKINKFENSPCMNEYVNFNIDSTYKYEIYLVLAKKDKIFEYGFDFFSNNQKNNFDNEENKYNNEENKYEHSKILLDNYEYFYDEDISSNDDIKHYLDETLFKLMTAICAIKDDEYKLAEILFIRLNKDKMEIKYLFKELGYFLKIINWKKVNIINLEDLYDNLELVNNETEEKISLKEFKKIIKTISDKYEIKFEIKQKDINFEIFETFLLNNENLSSRILMFYKKSYQHAMNMLMQSLKYIIQLTNEINMRKKFISRYISFLIDFKLGDYKNQDILDKIYLEKINNKKELFEKLYGLINKYCENNKHN